MLAVFVLVVAPRAARHCAKRPAGAPRARRHRRESDDRRSDPVFRVCLRGMRSNFTAIRPTPWGNAARALPKLAWPTERHPPFYPTIVMIFFKLEVKFNKP